MERIYSVIPTNGKKSSQTFKNRLKSLISKNFRSIIASDGLFRKSKLGLVPKVNLYELLGQWHVIACVPSSRDQKSYNSVMDLELTDDQLLKLHYVFNDQRKNGDVKQYIIQYSNVDPKNNNKWKSKNLSWYLSNLNVILFNTVDQILILSSSDKKYFWILSKEKVIPVSQKTHLYQWLENRGFDLTFVRTP